MNRTAFWLVIFATSTLHAQGYVVTRTALGDRATADRVIAIVASNGKLPRLDISRPVIGEVGVIPYDAPHGKAFVDSRVLQVIDDKQLHVLFTIYQHKQSVTRGPQKDYLGGLVPYEADHIDIWVRGISTAGLADDRRFALTGAWKVTGTHSYPTGSTKRTVFVIEPFDDPKLREAIKKAKEDAAAADAIRAKADAEAAKLEAENAARAKERLAAAEAAEAKANRDAQFRTFSVKQPNGSRAPLRAIFQSMKAGQVFLEKEDGTVIGVSGSQLSADDHACIRKLARDSK